MSCSCCFCGRQTRLAYGEEQEVPIWRGPRGREREFGCCLLCLRAGLRALGEVPDATSGVVELGRSMRRIPAAAGC